MKIVKCTLQVTVTYNNFQELEAIEEQWRSETKELVDVVAKLQEENRRLLKDQSPNHTATILTPTTENDMLQRLKDSIEKQRDEIRFKEKLLQEKADDVDIVSRQNH